MLKIKCLEKLIYPQKQNHQGIRFYRIHERGFMFEISFNLNENGEKTKQDEIIIDNTKHLLNDILDFLYNNITYTNKIIASDFDYGIDGTRILKFTIKLSDNETMEECNYDKDFFIITVYLQNYNIIVEFEQTRYDKNVINLNSDYFVDYFIEKLTESNLLLQYLYNID